ncbi:MAG: hypothetical protein HQL50_03040 [Magnetococcales bacterium]|nr:hypothetical protein [Magnetococcales bacterium]
MTAWWHIKPTSLTPGIQPGREQVGQDSVRSRGAEGAVRRRTLSRQGDRIERGGGSSSIWSLEAFKTGLTEVAIEAGRRVESIVLHISETMRAMGFNETALYTILGRLRAPPNSDPQAIVVDDARTRSELRTGKERSTWDPQAYRVSLTGAGKMVADVLTFMDASEEEQEAFLVRIDEGVRHGRYPPGTFVQARALLDAELKRREQKDQMGR